ncbi:MAG: hypothetical protein OXN93_07625 [bacterium]|nr:hypothetical protein [bacterium]
MKELRVGPTSRARNTRVAEPASSSTSVTSTVSTTPLSRARCSATVNGWRFSAGYRLALPKFQSLVSQPW